MSKYTEDDLKVDLENKEYEYGFYTELDSETFPIGLNEDIVRAISKKKEEPEWMTNWRIEAFRAWKEMTEPEWANVHYEKPDFQAISYYSAPKKADPNKTLDDVDAELLEMYKKLGISIDEQKKMNNVAAPNFEFENHKGGKTTLESLKGKYVYVDLWATWCGPCRAEIPSLKKMEELYHDKNIVFVSISVEPPLELLAHVAKPIFAFPLP